MAIYPPPSWNQPLPEWLSLQQAAALHGVSVDTLRRRIAAGRLPASRFGERLIRVRAEESRRLFRPIPTGDWPQGSARGRTAFAPQPVAQSPGGSARPRRVTSGYRDIPAV